MLVTIAGAEVEVENSTFDVDEAVEERSTCHLEVDDEAATHSFVKGQPVAVYDAAGALVFGGVIDTPKRRPLGVQGGWLWTLDCVDWHYLADKRVAARAYQNVTAGAAVTDLHTQYLAGEGVTLGEVQDGPTIVGAVFNYAPVSDALDALAEKAGFTWWIDPHRALHFVARGTDQAPWTVTGDDLQDADHATVTDGNPAYRNRQYVRGGKDVTDPQTQTFVGNSDATSFTLRYPLAAEPTVTLNGTPQGVGIKGLEDDTSDWLWNKGDAVLSQASGGVVLTSSDTLVVDYRGEYDLVVMVEDVAAISDRKTTEGDTSGLVESVEDVTQSTDRDASFELANAKLRKYAVDGRVVRFLTERSGLRAGQVATMNVPELGLNGEDLFVTSVQVRATDSGGLSYDATAVAGPVTGSWTKFFAALAKAQSVVDFVSAGSGEILATLTSAVERWRWKEAVTITAHACPVPAEGLYPSETLYPC